MRTLTFFLFIVIFNSALSQQLTIEKGILDNEVETFDMNLDRNFSEGSFFRIFRTDLPEDMRSVMVRNVQDFDGSGPHKLHIYMLGGLVGNFRDDCNVLIDAVDRETGQVHVGLLSSGGLPGYLNTGKVGQASFSLDNATYDITITGCPSGWKNRNFQGSVEIERTLVKDPSLIADNLTWNMTGEFKKSLSEPEIVWVSWAAEKNLNAEISDSREVAFESGEGWAVGGGINLDILHLQLEKQVSKSSEAKFEQILTDGRGTVLIGGLCKAHLVQKIKVSEYGKVSAPSLGISIPLDFTVTRAYFYESQALCKEGSGSNEVDSVLLKQAMEKVEAFKTNN